MKPRPDLPDEVGIRGPASSGEGTCAEALVSRCLPRAASFVAAVPCDDNAAGHCQPASVEASRCRSTGGSPDATRTRSTGTESPGSRATVTDSWRKWGGPGRGSPGGYLLVFCRSMARESSSDRFRNSGPAAMAQSPSRRRHPGGVGLAVLLLVLIPLWLLLGTAAARDADARGRDGRLVGVAWVLCWPVGVVLWMDCRRSERMSGEPGQPQSPSAGLREGADATGRG